jgi:CobW/HypB/UreG, nucleotide-binding domain
LPRCPDCRGADTGCKRPVPDRVPFVLVTGLPGAGKSALIERLLARRPSGARWAVVGNASGADADLGVACACCALPAVLRLTLPRLLKRAAWDRVVIEVAASAHPDGLIDALRTPELAECLVLERVVLVVDGSQPTLWRLLDEPASPDGPVARAADSPSLLGRGWALMQRHERLRALVESADEVLMTRPGDEARALAERLSQAPPFGRRICLGDWPQDVSQGAVTAPNAVGCVLTWPAQIRFDRPGLVQVLHDWRLAHPRLSARGVFATERAWYEWQVQPTREVDMKVSAYRSDNRCLIWDPDSRQGDPRWHAEDGLRLEQAAAQLEVALKALPTLAAISRT